MTLRGSNSGIEDMSKRQSVTFSDQAMVDLRNEAKRIGVTVSDLVRRIVDSWRDDAVVYNGPPLVDLITNITPLAASPLLQAATKKANST